MTKFGDWHSTILGEQGLYFEKCEHAISRYLIKSNTLLLLRTKAVP